MQTTTVQMIAEVRAVPQHADDLARLFTEFAEHTRNEPGCERFEVYRQTEEPNVFVAVMSFSDEQALQAHLEDEWRQRIVTQAADWLEGRPRRFTMQRFA